MTLLVALLMFGFLVVAQCCTPEPGEVNVARNGTASQSSDHQSKMLCYANKAIDGMAEVDFFKGFCSHTMENYEPWWHLDLKKTYNISSIVITNRQDSYVERLLGAEIRIGDSPGLKNPVCKKVTDVSKPRISLCCSGMLGRYVSVVIRGRSDQLVLCEVEVYAKENVTMNAEVNVARNGTASQSSVHQSIMMCDANKAIDGNADRDFNNGFCSHTMEDYDPWWHLDLKKTYNISSIVITNSQDGYMERLLGAEIRIGDSPDRKNPVCKKVTDVSKPRISLCCSGMSGRYVSVVIRGRFEHLALCEVEVYTKENVAMNAGNITWTVISANVWSTSNVVIFLLLYYFIMNLPWVWMRGARGQGGWSVLRKTGGGRGPGQRRGGMLDPRSCYLSVSGMPLLVAPFVFGFLIVTQCCTPEPGVVNVARNGEASQSSVYKSRVMGYANKAIDGNAETDFHKGFCTHTMKDYEPWWNLDLKKTYNISSIVITNRQYCCMQRLLGAEIRIGDSPDRKNPV
ncbi:uncharacterized protein [Aquarana catesbeiana]|uniref:uncharacterized protein n=1 Tax=Aquarana catesbeiana TaxID=8400 RepID=UPI003CC941EC